ncbi:hypothetical protein [Conexibacter sp. DBS9H8]|uniref:hypothetical protein n=1 Tax=Conexibacter sp. DBS9H8 TaxID=2937801 RepID=UPI00200F7CE3|nr:hypothetical protein [Conexibacter sp. DBS9H8]
MSAITAVGPPLPATSGQRSAPVPGAGAASPEVLAAPLAATTAAYEAVRTSLDGLSGELAEATGRVYATSHELAGPAADAVGEIVTVMTDAAGPGHGRVKEAPRGGRARPRGSAGEPRARGPGSLGRRDFQAGARCR